MHEYDDVEKSDCPPTADPSQMFIEDGLSVADVLEFAGQYRNRTDAAGQAYYSCLMQDVALIRANAQLMCDNIAKYRRNHQELANQARRAATSGGGVCSAQSVAQIGRAHV